MNPEAENLNIIGQLQANVFGPRPRDDSFTSSISSVSTINGALSATESLPLDPKVCNTDGTSDCHTLPQQSPPLQFESSLQRDSLKVHKDGQIFHAREPIPGQPLFAILMESTNDQLQTGDHILYQSSKPPFRITYRSALITEIQGTGSNLKVTIITNVPEIGVTQKQVYFDELKNLHKLVYDTCRYSSEESIDRARQRLRLKEKCYHALYNNSHFFVTWCKTSREYPLADILEQINQDPQVANKVDLAPIVYKTSVASIKILKMGDHVMLDSQHFLIDKVIEESNTFSAFFVSEGRVEWQELTWDPSGKMPFFIHCSMHPNAIDHQVSIVQAAEELKRKTKWESSDMFVTAMKCGRQHPLNSEDIIDYNVTLTGYTHITPIEKIAEGDHLVFTDLKNTFHSVLVEKCFSHTQVSIKPASEEGEVIDLTTYPEVYRVDYSSCLPPEQTLVRSRSQKLSQVDHSCFASWAKTGKELSLSPPKPKFIIESLKGKIDQIQVGDHIIEYTTESNRRRRHFMVTDKSSPSEIKLIFCQSGGLVREKVMDLSDKDLYRITYSQKCPPICEAIARAQSQLGQRKYSPWDQMLFIISAKLGLDGHENVYILHCKQLALKERVNVGEHLIMKDNQRNLYSVLVLNFKDCLQVEVKPLINGRNIVNLADFEVYCIEYDNSLPSRRSKSSLKKRSSLSLSDFMEAKFSVEKIDTVSQIQIGDHLIEWTNSTCRKHYIVTGITRKRSIFSVISRQGGDIHEEVLDFSNRGLNRLICHEKSQSVHEALKQVKLQLGQQCQIPWDELLLTMQVNSSKMPISKSQITSFSQLQLGDYVVKEPRIGSSHHYIIALIGLPNVCTAIESFQGKVSQENLPHPEPDKYPKYYRMNYQPGVCIKAEESVKLALSLVGKKYSRRGFVHSLKTNEEIVEINENLVELALQNHHDDDMERTNGPISKSEITDISQLQLGDYIVKKSALSPAHHYIITSIASSGTCVAIETFQGKISKVNFPNPQSDKHYKYFRMNYNPGSCVSIDKSIKKALLLVAEPNSFVHFLKTNEENTEIDKDSIELATKGPHNHAAPQYIKPVATINELKCGDHIVYNATRPPIMPVYYSSLILEIHTNESGDIDVITLEKSGLVEKKLNFDFLENLGKVVYQGCPFDEIHAVIRGRKALQFKENEHYNEQYNNSHHFMTRIKTGRETELSELLRIFIRTYKGKRSQQLKPVLTKVPIDSLGEIKAADHILIGSEHLLVRSIDVKNDTIKCYAIDSQKHIDCVMKEDIVGKKSKTQCHRIDYDSKSCLFDQEQVLRFAEEESLNEETKWERSDIFVTMAKCGSGFIIDERCILPNVVDMHCTDIVENISVDNGDHLLIKDKETGRFTSVLVYKFYHQRRIEVIPSISHHSFEREIIDLTEYKEKYRVNYSHSLPSAEVNVRAESQVGQDLLKEFSDNCCRFVSWAKTGKEIELSAKELLHNPRRICIVRPNSYNKILSSEEIRVGDHLFWDIDKVKTYREHIMVTECCVEGDPNKFMAIYCSKTKVKEDVKIFNKTMGEDTYRINYQETLPVDLTLKRARHHLGGHMMSPLARLWFIRWAKTGSDEGIEVSFLRNNTRPVTKSRISCFSQLNPGDYIVAEPRMNFYHHYIVLSIDSPTQCVVAESWRKMIQRRVLNFEKISDPNERPWYYRINYEKGICMSPEDSTKLAMDLINTWHLNPMSKCVREGFVHYLKTGEAAEIDTDELLDDRTLLQREIITSAMELKRGDHIERPLSFALIASHAQHHMFVVDPIDDEHCEVIHYKVNRNPSKILKFKKGDVVCEIVNIFEQGQVSRIRYPERIDPVKGMKILKELSGDGGKLALKQLTGMEEYNLKENNCEHLITIATIGVPFSIQVEKAILYALQCSKGVVRSCRGSLTGQASNCCIGNCCPGDIAAQAIIPGVGDPAQIGNVITNAPTVAAEAAFKVGSEAAINGTILGAIGGVAFGINVLLETPFYIRGAYKLGRKKKFEMISKEEYQREMIKITFKSVNTVVGGTLGAVAGQAAIPVPVLGAVVGGFVGGVVGQACGYLEGKALGYAIRDPTTVTLPMLNSPTYLTFIELREQLKGRSKGLCTITSEVDDTN